MFNDIHLKYMVVVHSSLFIDQRKKKNQEGMISNC